MKPSNQAVAAEKPAMLLPMLALALSVVGIASAPILVRVSEVDPTATLMLRMVFAGAIVATVPILGPWRAEDAKTSWSRGKTVAAVVVSGLIFTLDLLANHWAVVLTSVANTTLLMNTTPIFALVIAAIFFGEVISRQKLISMAVAIAGGAMLVGESVYLEASLTSMAGDMLAVASAILYATYLNMTKGLRGHLSGRTITFLNSAVCAGALFPVVLMTSESALPATGWGYATVIGLAVISQILGHGMMAYALKHVEAGLASMTSLIRPAVSVFLAWLFLAEPLSLLQAAGGGLILLAIYFFNR
jgi:drug/metabolite transporter (DMT)-like permease